MRTLAARGEGKVGKRGRNPIADLARFLEKARDESASAPGISCRELDDELGLPEGTVADIEQGNVRPPEGLVWRILAFLHANVQVGRALWLRVRWQYWTHEYADGEATSMSFDEAIRIVELTDEAGAAADRQLGYHDPDDDTWVTVMLEHFRRVSRSRPRPVEDDADSPRFRIVRDTEPPEA